MMAGKRDGELRGCVRVIYQKKPTRGQAIGCPKPFPNGVFTYGPFALMPASTL